jgi:hypothetical protein
MQFQTRKTRHTNKGSKLHMKKTVKYTAVGLGIIALFGTGTFVGAGVDWKSTAINSAYNDLLATANTTNTELTADVSGDINKQVETQIADTVEQQQLELERLLEEYYKMKLEGYTTSEEFLELEQQIITIRENVLDSFKKRIDEAFVGK